MKITVYYKSGARQVFIVPTEIHVVEFRQMAEEIGGEILKVEFVSPSSLSYQNCAEKNKI
jgi:hypothetical protein